MHKLLCVLIIIAVAAPMSMAQVRFGGTAGLNMANNSFDGTVAAGLPDPESKMGMLVGAVVEYPINDALSI